MNKGGRKHVNPLIKSHRINVYLDDRSFRVWETIPNMRRSKFVKDALRNYEQSKTQAD